MVPIHDTDLDDRRWEELSWKNFELWEKTEIQERKRRRIWIFSTLVVFLALSSVTVILAESQKWQTLVASRILAQEISRMKTDALIRKQAFRIRFSESGQLHYAIERADRCDSTEFVLEREGGLFLPEFAGAMMLLGPQQAATFSMPGLIESFCYDPLEGNTASSEGSAPLVFAIAPVKDLSEGNLDHLSLVLLKGRSAEISFE